MPEGLTGGHEQLFVSGVEARFRRILRKAYKLKTLNKLPLTSLDPKLDPAMPKDGDALVICRADGTTDFLVLGNNHVALSAKLASGADMTDAEITQLDAVFKAMALFLATKNEAVMDALTEMANAPGVIDLANLPGLH